MDPLSFQLDSRIFFRRQRHGDLAAAAIFCAYAPTAAKVMEASEKRLPAAPALRGGKPAG